MHNPDQGLQKDLLKLCGPQSVICFHEEYALSLEAHQGRKGLVST